MTLSEHHKVYVMLAAPYDTWTALNLSRNTLSGSKFGAENLRFEIAGGGGPHFDCANFRVSSHTDFFQRRLTDWRKRRIVSLIDSPWT
jgi:hypothetical protein